MATNMDALVLERFVLLKDASRTRALSTARSIWRSSSSTEHDN